MANEYRKKIVSTRTIGRWLVELENAGIITREFDKLTRCRKITVHE